MENESKQECPVPKGILVIIGGKENKGEKPDSEVQEENGSPLEILKTIVKLINKPDPLVEIITTASSEGEESYKEYVAVFKKIGVKRSRHIHHNSRPEVMAQRGPFVRMAQIIITNPTCIGIGIEEDSAIIVGDGLNATVIGSGVVSL